MTPEALLAEALRDVLNATANRDALDPAGTAAAILATPAGSELARLASIGAAVERLQRYRSRFVLDWSPHAWLVTSSLPESKGVAATLPEAIAAALGTDG